MEIASVMWCIDPGEILVVCSHPQGCGRDGSVPTIVVDHCLSTCNVMVYQYSRIL